jgi:hypothetical protein
MALVLSDCSEHALVELELVADAHGWDEIKHMTRSERQRRKAP